MNQRRPTIVYVAVERLTQRPSRACGKVCSTDEKHDIGSVVGRGATSSDEHL